MFRRTLQFRIIVHHHLFTFLFLDTFSTEIELIKAYEKLNDSYIGSMSIIFNENFDQNSKHLDYRLQYHNDVSKEHLRFQLCIDMTFMKIKHNKTLNLEV